MAKKASGKKTSKAAIPQTPVDPEVVSIEPAEATPVAEKAKAKKARKIAKPKKLSALNAAAQVLQEAGQPMTCKEMIDAMTTRKLWTSPNGATPEATLYSAILRELKVKGDAARFVKTERGKFAFKAQA